MTEELKPQVEETKVEEETEHDLYSRQLGVFRRLAKEDWERASEVMGLWHLHSLEPEEKMKLFGKFGFTPKQAQEYYNMGVEAANKGDFKSAEKNFKAALEDNSEFDEALYNLALTYEHIGNIDKALDLWHSYQERIGSRHSDYSAIRSHIRTLKKKSE